MADYFDQTVVQQAIPDADMTPIERLPLSHIFDCEREADAWYFFAEEGPSTTVLVTRNELEEALAASTDTKSVAHTYVTEQLVRAGVDETELDLDLDLTGTSWEFFFQDIVKRSKTLRYISVLTAFTCSKMRLDGFGGMAVLITADAIMGKSTKRSSRGFSYRSWPR